MASLPSSHRPASGRSLLRKVRRTLRREHDLLTAEQLAAISAAVHQVKAARQIGETPSAQAATRLLGDFVRAHQRNAPFRFWRLFTHMAVLLLVLYFAIPAYFVQLYTVPTDAMRPAIHGNRVTPVSQPLPGAGTQFLHRVLYGRTYFQVVPLEPDRVVMLEPAAAPGVRVGTAIHMESGRTYTVPAPMRSLIESFQLQYRMEAPAGQPLVRGYATWGDQVVVDRVTYHFRKPRRADVLAFRTAGIPAIDKAYGAAPGQKYTKRLVGLPGETIRIEPPRLLVNGAEPREPAIQEIVRRAPGYTVPSASMEVGDAAKEGSRGEFQFNVPRGHHFALGDNSANSWDGRYWGAIPEQSVHGRVAFIWWPLSDHWGLVQ